MAENNKRQDINTASLGMNMDQVSSQLKPGTLTYALNAAVETLGASSVTYQNELGNEFCTSFTEGYVLIGCHHIVELEKHVLFLASPSTGGSEIGYIDRGDCNYHVLVNDPCLNFSTSHPVHKVVHRITSCSTEIFWADALNPRRYMDINNVPRKLVSGTPSCDPVYSSELDCNQLLLQPDFNIPYLSIKDVVSGGDLEAGAYQFAVQYSDALGNPYTSYYSITNPVPVADTREVTPNFNYPVGKSIVVRVDNCDMSGQFKYFNLAVIKTVNAISSVELVGTYSIEEPSREITFTGQDKSAVRLSMDDIFEKFPYYESAGDVTTAQDILIWGQLSLSSRVNYQKIANQVRLQWESWRIPATENYSDEINAANLRGYLRDEVYPFEISFLLGKGKQTDSFHIPGRPFDDQDDKPDVPSTNDDFVGEPDYDISGTGYKKYWKVYNTATVGGTYQEYKPVPSYKGKYQWGEMAYWESTEEYPCNEDIWGDLAGKPIRHHKFPDALVSPVFESRVFSGPGTMTMGNQAVFPLGLRVNVQDVMRIIDLSDLTQQEKDEIVGFKITRGDRSSNKSIVAKGMLRNVNSYDREGTTFYFPNYPYNDLNEDPFLNSANNAFAEECEPFDVVITALEMKENHGMVAEVEYTDCTTNKRITRLIYSKGTTRICSIRKPVISIGKGTVSHVNYDRYLVESRGDLCSGFRVQYNDITEGIKEKWVNGGGGGSRWFKVNVVIGSVPVCVYNCDKSKDCESKMIINFEERVIVDNSCSTPPEVDPLPGVDKDSAFRLVFNSPETSFGQPFLGDVIKLESVMFGQGKAHFAEVKDNAKYKLLSKEAQLDALMDAAELGGMTENFDIQGMFAAYQAYLNLHVDGVTRRNYAYSFNSIASYDYNRDIANGLGVKQRSLDIAKYMIPAVVSTGDDHDVNNYQRESSVYLKTSIKRKPLLFPHETPSMLAGGTPVLKESSRFTISGRNNCTTPSKEERIEVVSYYASLKNIIPNQWGQVYSYDTVDTGCQVPLQEDLSHVSIFGGDTFINRFAYKTKLPFFIDNRVGAPDDSDIFYDEIGNVAYPKYWHSSRSILEDFSVPNTGSDDGPGIMRNIISYKAHNFDCPNMQGTTDPVNPSNSQTGVAGRTYYDGYFYLFAYGIPSFYCESSYNVDLRQAFNDREGDFFPHVSSGIPDDWLQESRVSILNDNTYYYNKSFSKQNKENTFTHLPADWSGKKCMSEYPFRVIYSDPQDKGADSRVNAWRTYRALSYFDLPQNHGKLVSLDGVQNGAVLARFENKTLLYNNLLTIDTSNPQAAFVGNPRLFKGAPPVDFAQTDLGHVGTQNKMFLRVPEGQLMVDAKRGQVFMINGTRVDDISGFGSGMSRFFGDHLPFEILKYFPGVNVDNHFNGIGLHGVYDATYNRIILTKKDYTPLVEGIKTDGNDFYFEDEYKTIVYRCDLSGSAMQVDRCALDGYLTV